MWARNRRRCGPGSQCGSSNSGLPGNIAESTCSIAGMTASARCRRSYPQSTRVTTSNASRITSGTMSTGSLSRDAQRRNRSVTAPVIAGTFGCRKPVRKNGASVVRSVFHSWPSVVSDPLPKNSSNPPYTLPRR